MKLLVLDFNKSSLVATLDKHPIQEVYHFGYNDDIARECDKRGIRYVAFDGFLHGSQLRILEAAYA